MATLRYDEQYGQGLEQQRANAQLLVLKRPAPPEPQQTLFNVATGTGFLPLLLPSRGTR